MWFDPELRVDYRPRPTLRALARQYAEYGAWKRHVLRLHPGSLKLRQAVPPVALISMVVAVAISPWFPLALAVPAIYVAVVVASSAVTSQRHFPRLLAIFPTIHMSWAWGFLFRRR